MPEQTVLDSKTLRYLYKQIDLLTPTEANKLLQNALLPVQISESPTEQRNKRSFRLSDLNSQRICELMHEDMSEASELLKNHMKPIGELADQALRALKKGGRILYLGAGNSGRLAMLDAAECPGTFGCTEQQVQVLQAGGQSAWIRDVDGAEDDALDGVRQVQNCQVNANDFVLGLTASGQTAFVWGGLFASQQLGSNIAILSFNPHFQSRLELCQSLQIDCGPEVLTGSTRLKCGTLTKNILNMISTSAMVQLGKCISNLMVDVQPSNMKLKRRLVNILLSLVNTDQTRITTQFAQELLEHHSYQIRAAVDQLRPIMSAQERNHIEHS